MNKQSIIAPAFLLLAACGAAEGDATEPFAAGESGEDESFLEEEDLLAEEAEVEANASAEEATSVDVGKENETEPLLVDFEPDPSMFFGESDEEQERASIALGEAFFGGGVVQKRVNTSSCLQFTVPPFVGPPGDIQFFSNTLPVGGLTPTNTCGFGTFGESRRVFIQNFTTLSRAGSGNVSVGVRNASVAECADLRVALAVAEQRGPNQSTVVLFSSNDIPAQVQQRNGVGVCASYIPMFGTFEPQRFADKDLWIAVLARRNGTNINSRVHLIRQSDI